MKKIKLTKGKFALVDDSDFEFLSQWNWHFDLSTGYAARTLYPKGKAYMHRLVNKTLDNLGTDHINQNKLDNRRENLRTADKRINGINRGVQKNNKSGYKNIHFEKRRNQWVVDVRCFKKRAVKQFKSLEEAIIMSEKIRKEIYYQI